MDPTKDKKIHDFNNLLEEELTKNNINIISESEVVKGEEIGLGAFGQVFKGTYKQDYIVAIKKLLFEVTDLKLVNDKVKEIVNEITIIQLAKHDNIPVFYGIWKIDGDLNLIFEFIDGMMLKDYFPTCNFNKKVSLLIQLTTILEFFHSKKLIHRDIKPGNVMISKDEKVYLIDFGTSKIAKNTKTYTASPSGTISYIPPEAFNVDLDVDKVEEGGDGEEDENKKNGKILEISTKYDIWSMGCMISEIFSGISPWSNKVKGVFAIQNALIMKKPFPIPKKELFEPEIIPIIKECTDIDVDKRASATRLLELLLTIPNKNS